MKENLKHPLAIVFSIFVFLFLFAKFAPSFPISVLTQQKGEPLIVSGEGKVTVVPDIAKISLGIEETGLSLKDVQNKVNQKSQDLTSVLKKLGIGEKDIKTAAYNVYPEYNYGVNPQKITGYRISTTYEVKIKDFEKINEVLVKATEAGVNSIGNIAFEVNETTKNAKLNEARKQAVEEAKTKADGLAHAAGISLGKIINVSESQGAEPRPYYALKEGIDSATPVQPDIQPGETELSVTVSLSFEIR
jgi:hypothetical protein